MTTCKRLAAALCLLLAALPAWADMQARAWSAVLPTPALVLQNLQGRATGLAEFRGKAVLLNFWATWCEPCREEMPTLQQLADVYGPDKLVVLTVNVKDSRAKAQQFMQGAGLDMTVLLDGDGQAARQWQVSIYPTTVLIGADGEARWRIVGQADWTSQEAERLIAGLFQPARR
jgi:thiol-disulfide isomerase/thioredoxin